MFTHYRKAAAAAGSVLAVVAIAATVYVLHGTARPQPASHHPAAVARPAGASVPAGSQGAAALPSPSQLSSPAAAPAQAPKTPVAQVPAVAPAASASPAGPDPLTTCPQLGATTTDGAGNLVMCMGSSAAPVWACDPNYPYPAAYPAVLGQPAPPDGWPQVVLDLTVPVYVKATAGTWQAASPPC